MNPELKGNSNNNGGNTFNVSKTPAELKEQHYRLGHKTKEALNAEPSIEKNNVSDSMEQKNFQNNNTRSETDNEVTQPPVINSQESEEPVKEKEASSRNIIEKALGAIKNLFSEKKPNDNYSFLEHASESDKKSKFMREIFKDLDRSSKKGGIDMPRELGEMVEAYVNNTDYWVGIHHSYLVNGALFEHDSSLQGIMEEGLCNHGDASGGAVYKDPPLKKTLRYCGDMMHAGLYLKGSYKGSTGAVLVAIPRKFLEKGDDWYDCNIKPGAENSVYDHNSTGTSFVKPEYIVGFVQNLGKGSTLQFKPRAEILAAAAEDKKNEQSQK